MHHSTATMKGQIPTGYSLFPEIILQGTYDLMQHQWIYLANLLVVTMGILMEYYNEYLKAFTQR